MRDMCMGNEKAKLSLKEVLLGALALVVIVGFGTGVYAAPAKNADKSLSDQTSTFDPFTLQSTPPSVTESVSESTSVQGQAMVLGEIIPIPQNWLSTILIPFRPPCRSSHRPPLVPNSSQ